MSTPVRPGAPSPRSTVRRKPDRAAYDPESLYAIIDEALVCHVGFVVDGRPVVIPTAHGRAGDTLYLHGAAASRLMRTLAEGLEVCVTIALVDGVVLARSAFHHSLNYRSVVVFGRATVVSDPAEKRAALAAFTDHVVPGRYEATRQPTDAELAGTLVLALPLAEGSAKVRSGPPIDDPADLDHPIWAGVIPLATVPGAPQPDPLQAPDLPVPDHVSHYRRG